MSDKWIPGPWRVNKYGSVGAGEYGTQPIITTVEPFYGPDKKYGDHVANARLIAAAPEMAKALDAAIPFLAKYPDGLADDLVAEARTALAKARGLA